MSILEVADRRGTPFDQFEVQLRRQVEHMPIAPVVRIPVSRPRKRRVVRSVAPERSLQQRMEALARANDFRLRRSQLKRDMKAGGVLAQSILADPPEWAATMKVMDLLLAVPKYGTVKAHKQLKLAQASPSKTLAGLSGRQRTELIALLEGRR